jgi:hypothetical protein
VLLLVWDPSWLVPVLAPPASSMRPPPSGSDAALIDPVAVAEAEPQVPRTTPAERGWATRSAADTAAPPTRPGVSTGARTATPAPDPDAAERLRYRASPLWAPVPPPVMTEEECWQRRYAAALERGIADPAYGAVPAPAAGPTRGGMEAGIRIPVGRKPPPPPVFLPAPVLPDTTPKPPANVAGQPGRRAPLTESAIRIQPTSPSCLDSVPPLLPRPPRR